MSARTEQLLDEITNLKVKLMAESAQASVTRDFSTVRLIEQMIKDKERQLTSANEALTEGKQVLKG